MDCTITVTMCLGLSNLNRRTRKRMGLMWEVSIRTWEMPAVMAILMVGIVSETSGITK
jgi:hypothetical protein